MRNILIVIQVAVVLFLVRFCNSVNTPSTAYMPSEKIQAQVVSNRKNLGASSSIKLPAENSKALIEFLNKTADARMMDLEEGRLAEKQGTTREIRAYGKIIKEDQLKMLNEIDSIARNRNISLIKEVSEEERQELKDIKALKGHRFDRKLIRIMKIDLRRDIRKLKAATKSDDPEVKRIGTKYLPLVRSHLSKVKHL